MFAAHTADGGRSFTRRGYLGDEPAGMSIMPSSVLADDGSLLTAVRCHGPRDGRNEYWIDLYRSADEGTTWEHVARPVGDTGTAGNPPALRRVGGRLVCIYGFRGRPSGLRYVTSGDEGRSWSEPITVTSDTPMRDMGYPRAVVMGDGSVLACFYNNRGDESERFIEAVRWRP